MCGWAGALARTSFLFHFAIEEPEKRFSESGALNFWVPVQPNSVHTLTSAVLGITIVVRAPGPLHMGLQ